MGNVLSFFNFSFILFAVQFSTTLFFFFDSNHHQFFFSLVISPFFDCFQKFLKSKKRNF